MLFELKSGAVFKRCGAAPAELQQVPSPTAGVVPNAGDHDDVPQGAALRS